MTNHTCVSHRKRIFTICLLAALLGMGLPAKPVQAALGPILTETGKISWSVDGLGVEGTGVLQVQKPAGATVRKAVLLASSSPHAPASNCSVSLEGTTLTWAATTLFTDPSDSQINNTWADVTSIIQSKVNAAAAGLVDLSATDVGYCEAMALVVIFDDPGQTVDNTVIIMTGSQKLDGDTAEVTLAKPIDKTAAGFKLHMSVGISYSYQNGGIQQYSVIKVNNQLMTSSAGGSDDADGSYDGTLATVGGIGDDPSTNPADPAAIPSGSDWTDRYDDEFYNLRDFVKNGDKTITTFTQNPSNDDYIFFIGYFIGANTASADGSIPLVAPNNQAPSQADPTELPRTGFAPGRVTVLPSQPGGNTSPGTGITLRIRQLGLEVPVVGVPRTGNTWDVSWLGRQAGYLYGTAFPTWEGNSVITGHVWDADNQPGIFIDLQDLRVGDTFQVETYGQVATYRVRENSLLLPDQVRVALRSYRGNSWVTLLTCEDYRERSGIYRLRRMVRAELVDLELLR